MTDFPALNGETVTERHARICREQGHATHTVDGVDSGVCPRCGEVTEVTADDIELARAVTRATFESRGAQLLRTVTATQRVLWSPEIGWHGAVDGGPSSRERAALLARDICPDCDYHVDHCHCDDTDSYLTD